MTLSGAVHWQYQRVAAESAVRELSGVISVTNRIEVRPKVAPRDVKQKILDALKRNAELEADAIRVNVIEGKVVLEGNVKHGTSAALPSMLRGPRPASKPSKMIWRSADGRIRRCSVRRRCTAVSILRPIAQSMSLPRSAVQGAQGAVSTIDLGSREFSRARSAAAYGFFNQAPAPRRATAGSA